MTTRLEGLEIERVDFVDKGANPDAHITLFKRDTTMPEQDVKTEKEATDAVVTKQLSDLEKRAADAEAKAKEATELLTKSAERIAKLEEDRENETFVRKAQEYSRITKPEEFAPIYRKIHKTLDEKEREWFGKWLNSMNQIAKSSALFKEIGVGGEMEQGDAYAKLEKMARDLIAKADTKMTFEQAFSEVCETKDGQKLYSEYLKESE